MENILSVGIDIGTTTTQVVFSRLFLENTAGYFNVPQISIVDKRVIYSGLPHFTPLLDAARLDASSVRLIVEGEYAKAHILPQNVSAGAVIITGESARKENASALIQITSGLAGEFVVAAAGPDMESVIAGKGSGAYAYSKQNHKRIVNLDIGGGTTNAVIFNDGKTVSTGCYDIGGRLVRTDSNGAIDHISPAAMQIAKWHNIPLSIGLSNIPSLLSLAEAMASLLAQALGLTPKTELLELIKTPDSSSFEVSGGIDALCFSGGVSDAVYGRFSGHDDFRFGDIGIILGRAIARNPALRSLAWIPPEQTLRATVIGAGSYATSVSGSTIDTATDALPIKNLQVFKLSEQEQESLFSGSASALLTRITAAAKQGNQSCLAISLRGKRDPTYEEVKSLASSLSGICDAILPPSAPIVIVLEEDMAKALGQALKSETSRPVISIDGIVANEHDYIDIGKPVSGNLVVPVVVKTLLFGGKTQQ